MKITRRQLRKLIQEASDGREQLFSLIKSGDSTQIKQARDLAESLGMDFRQLVEEFVRRENAVETPEVDEVIEFVLVPLRTARATALSKLGINIRESISLGEIDTGEDLDILEELRLTIRDRSQEAVELAVVQTIMKLSQ